jgi:hypothetical protein
MDIREQLLRQHSKANTQAIAAWIGDDPQRFATLMACLMEGEVVPVQRASWVVSDVGCVYPHLLLPHLDALLDAVATPMHLGVQRNVLKAIAETHMVGTELQEGRLVDLCFTLVADPATPVATQVHAIQCILNRLPQYPDLAIELRPLLEDGLRHASPGYTSKAKYALKLMNKLPKQ